MVFSAGRRKLEKMVEMADFLQNNVKRRTTYLD